MGTILALAAAVLYGSADFMGGAAARRTRPITVLVITTAAGAAVMTVAALVTSMAGIGGSGLAGSGGTRGLTWGVTGGVAGVAGLLLFYLGFSVAPMSVVAPVSALASTLLPLGVAIAQGERPGPAVVAGGFICLVAGVMFGLFFLFFRNAGTSGVLWPVAAARIAGAALACCAWLLTRGRRGPAASARARAEHAPRSLGALWATRAKLALGVRGAPPPGLILGAPPPRPARFCRWPSHRGRSTRRRTSVTCWPPAVACSASPWSSRPCTRE